jgi:hypothetical protein
MPRLQACTSITAAPPPRVRYEPPENEFWNRCVTTRPGARACDRASQRGRSAFRFPGSNVLHVSHDLSARDQHVRLVLGVALLEQTLEQSMPLSRQRKREIELHVGVAVGVRKRGTARILLTGGAG